MALPVPEAPLSHAEASFLRLSISYLWAKIHPYFRKTALNKAKYRPQSV
jgi:hypothetical protein